MADFSTGAQKSPEKTSISPQKGEKRPIDEVSDGQGNGEGVHSANAWEQANLGDDDRKQKFLRLMGAGKKHHQGRFVIGDTTTVHTKAVESEKKAKEIEVQYSQSLGHKFLGGGRHAGFGFHNEGPGPSDQAVDMSKQFLKGGETTTEKETKEIDAKDKESDATDKKEKNKFEGEKDSSKDGSEKGIEKPVKASVVEEVDKLSEYKKMSFVKSSS